MKKREYGLDLLKLLACLGVVAIHTLNINKGVLNMVFAMSAAICIPTFLLVGGYLMLKRSGFSWHYAGKKIATILLVCLAWEALHAAAHFVAYREIRPFVQSWLLDFFQKGLFYHFWYMGALMLMYLAMPLLDKLMQHSPATYRNILIGLSIFNGVTDLILMLAGSRVLMSVPQSLRLQFWLFYAMLGGWIARNPEPVAKLRSKLRLWHVLVVLGMSILYVRYLGRWAYGGADLELFYGSAVVQLCGFLVFVYGQGLKLSDHAGKRVVYLGSLTMGIYIMHPFVLAVLNKFVPAFTQGGAVMNLLFWIATTVICAIGTLILQKIPLLNRLLKL